MTSVYDKKKTEDFSKDLNKLLIKYGFKIALNLQYTKQAIVPVMELVQTEEDKEKKEDENKKKNGELNAN